MIFTKANWKIILWVTLFGISMGFFESAVVIYIRALYFPDGFAFPLVAMEEYLALTELLRETASMIMILTVAILAGKKLADRLAYFIYIFAIWDIFYYVFLKALLDWPESFMTWDVLFLIPMVWTGPVIAPLILTFLMIVFAFLIIWFDQHLPKVKIFPLTWLLLITGSIVVITAFCWDFARFVFARHSFAELMIDTWKGKLFELTMNYIPQSFNWPMFISGVIIISSGIIWFYIKSNHYRNP